MKDSHQQHIAHTIHLRMLHDLKASAQNHMEQSVINRLFGKEPQGGDVDEAVKRNPMDKGGTYADLTARCIAQWRQIVQQYRQARQPKPKPDYKTIAIRNWMAARNMVGSLSFDFKSKPEWRPDVSCYPGEPSRIYAKENGKVALPIHWHRTVKERGIAICEWIQGERKRYVLVVRAKAQPSAFLSEMGISYCEVEGLRIGAQSERVTGYAFASPACSPLFSLTFKYGVEQMKSRVETATLNAMDL